jgi:hypothetical protein
MSDAVPETVKPDEPKVDHATTGVGVAIDRLLELHKAHTGRTAAGVLVVLSDGSRFLTTATQWLGDGAVVLFGSDNNLDGHRVDALLISPRAIFAYFLIEKFATPASTEKK